MNLLLPPLVAAMLLSIAALAASAGKERMDLHDLLQLALIILMCAYFYALIPSLICTLWMERSYNRGLSPTSSKALRISTLCGGLSGILLAAFFALSGGPGQEALLLLLILAIVGVLTGFIVGLLVGFSEKHTLSKK